MVTVKRPKGFVQTTIAIVKEFLDDKCMNLAAAITYFIIQAIVPLILGVLVVASFFLQKGQGRETFIKSVQESVPQLGIDLGKIIDDLVGAAPGLLSLSALLLLWSGSGIFDQLVQGINVAFGVRKDNRNFFVLVLLRFALMFMVTFIILASFAATVISQIIFNVKDEIFGISPSKVSFLLPLVLYLISILLIFGVFVLLYKLGPDRKGIRWRPVLIGALVAAILFEVLKNAFSFYITGLGGADSYAKTYGALGGILIFLLFLWITSTIMLFGAEVVAVLDGWKPGPPIPEYKERPGEESDNSANPESEEDEKAGSSKQKEKEPALLQAAIVTRPVGPKTPANMAIGGAIVAASLALGFLFKPKD